MTAQSDSSPDLNTRLARALHFGPEDRAANLEGRLSAAQVAFLETQGRADRRNRFLTAGLFGTIGLFFTITATDMLNLILFGLVVGSILYLAVRDWRLVQADLAEQTVGMVEGSLSAPSRRNLAAMFQEPSLVLVGEERLHLAPDLRKLFLGSYTFRFFYTPNARVILGAEALDDDEDDEDDEVVFDALPAPDADEDVPLEETQA